MFCQTHFFLFSFVLLLLNRETHFFSLDNIVLSLAGMKNIMKWLKLLCTALYCDIDCERIWCKLAVCSNIYDKRMEQENVKCLADSHRACKRIIFLSMPSSLLN